MLANGVNVECTVGSLPFKVQFWKSFVKSKILLYKANNSLSRLTGENAILQTLGKSVKLKDAQQCSYYSVREDVVKWSGKKWEQMHNGGYASLEMD